MKAQEDDLSEGRVTIGALILLALWLFIGLPWLNAPLDRVEYRDAPQHAKQETQRQPSGSAESPYFVQLVPLPKSAQERQDEAEDREEKKSSDRWLVRWTFALFAATIGLILATGVLGYFGWRQSKDMRESVDAANRTADIAETTLLSVEIPYLYPLIRDHGFRVGLSPRSGQRGVIDLDFGLDFLKFYFQNFGRTPAEITEVQSILLPSVGMPNRYPSGPRNLNPLSGHIVAADGGKSQDFLHGFSKGMFETFTQGRFNPDTHIFYFLGFVRYNDVFENEYVKGFCLGYSPMTDRFYPVGGDGYNYRRKTKSTGQDSQGQSSLT